LREKEAVAAECGLLDPAASDAAILAAMVEHPVLVNRPIVRTPKGAAMCRPSERVIDLLERRPDHFVKEDGEVI
ncbi:MAG: arsenate reductase (glutaredoxin), partial [Pseudomonadota bacterium]|nr:arsenate reductase (glutaredoxin) [Pseudomonadota bacterium]